MQNNCQENAQNVFFFVRGSARTTLGAYSVLLDFLAGLRVLFLREGKRNLFLRKLERKERVEEVYGMCCASSYNPPKYVLK